jgi:peptidoglycan/LPS O-acetylase OafA/YrhL
LYPSHLNQVRIYFGTDTRAQGLLVGAAAALLWSSGFRLSQVVSLGLAGLGALAICLVATQVRDANPFRVNGAFPLLAVSTALVLLNVVWEPGSLFARVLSWSPLRWAGRRSYAIYLWHAPIATFLYGTPTGLSGATRFGWAGFVGGIALSLVLAELSWRWLESRFQGAGRPARAAAPAATA